MCQNYTSASKNMQLLIMTSTYFQSIMKIQRVLQTSVNCVLSAIIHCVWILYHPQSYRNSSWLWISFHKPSFRVIEEGISSTCISSVFVWSQISASYKWRNCWDLWYRRLLEVWCSATVCVLSFTVEYLFNINIIFWDGTQFSLLCCLRYILMKDI